MQALLSSSTAERSKACSSGRYWAAPYTRSRGPAPCRASAMHSMRPPLSSQGSAAPPRRAAMLRCRAVKLSTSPVRESRSPQARQSSRSASWLYCSGTSSRSRPSGLVIFFWISAMTAAVLPVPARPMKNRSIRSHPFAAIVPKNRRKEKPRRSRGFRRGEMSGYSASRLRISHTSAYTRCTEATSRRSRAEWMSVRSGPKDTASRPGSLPMNSPHSSPPWVA